MPKDNRIRIIQEIEKLRGSRVITYLTSTRQNLEVQMAMDSVRIVYDHLTHHFTTRDKAPVDLYIHSNGGDGTVPWRLVTLIREYSSQLSVLIPHRAFSAATLTALGADKIVMHPMAMLGPTDPTVANAFNPVDPQTNQKVGISVEDVTAYIALIKDDAGIQHEDEMVQAFNKLADHVHPLALGNVKRSLSQSRLMARKLLHLHTDSSHAQHQIDKIVDNLTSKLFFHGHPINRKEAVEELGLRSVEEPGPELEALVWELYRDYETEMRLEEPFMPVIEFNLAFPQPAPGQTLVTPPATAKIAYIESIHQTNVNKLNYQISGAKQPNGTLTAATIMLSQGWEIE